MCIPVSFMLLVIIRAVAATPATMTIIPLSVSVTCVPISTLTTTPPSIFSIPVVISIIITVPRNMTRITALRRQTQDLNKIEQTWQKIKKITAHLHDGNA